MIFQALKSPTVAGISPQTSEMQRHPLFWLERHNIVKMAIVPQVIHRFSKIPVTILATLFWDCDKLILKFIWKGKAPKLLEDSSSRVHVDDQLDPRANEKGFLICSEMSQNHQLGRT